MGSANSVAYMQRQIDKILRKLREWCRAYVDDIVAVSDILDDHIYHLYQLFA